MVSEDDVKGLIVLFAVLVVLGGAIYQIILPALNLLLLFVLIVVIVGIISYLIWYTWFSEDS